jgi:hypothetical protein
MKKVTKQKRPQPWTWAQAHEERVRKHWNWKLLDAMWDNRKAQYLTVRATQSLRLESVWVQQET